MRLVVDTNVFVSARPQGIIVASQHRSLAWNIWGLLKTSITETEVLDVLQRPRIAPKTAPLFLHNVRGLFAAAELMTITERVTECRDSKDDKFLELAVNGHADAIIS